MPYQLGTEHNDNINIREDNILIEKDDILIIGSSGLFNNLNIEQIRACIEPFLFNDIQILDLNLISNFIAEHSFNISQSFHIKTPFSLKSYQYFYEYKGGKIDDISVLTTKIV